MSRRDTSFQKVKKRFQHNSSSSVCHEPSGHGWLWLSQISYPLWSLTVLFHFDKALVPCSAIHSHKLVGYVAHCFPFSLLHLYVLWRQVLLARCAYQEFQRSIKSSENKYAFLSRFSLRIRRCLHVASMTFLISFISTASNVLIICGEILQHSLRYMMTNIT